MTLTGVVLSQVDKLLAQSLATGRGEMGVTNAAQDRDVNGVRSRVVTPTSMSTRGRRSGIAARGGDEQASMLQRLTLLLHC